jgi:hypothetical protein
MNIQKQFSNLTLKQFLFGISNAGLVNPRCKRGLDKHFVTKYL